MGELGHTGDHNGDITLWLRLALGDIAVLFEVDGPTLLRTVSVLDLELETTIGLRARGTGASKQSRKNINATSWTAETHLLDEILHVLVREGFESGSNGSDAF